MFIGNAKGIIQSHFRRPIKGKRKAKGRGVREKRKGNGKEKRKV